MTCVTAAMPPIDTDEDGLEVAVPAKLRYARSSGSNGLPMTIGDRDVRTLASFTAIVIASGLPAASN